MSAEVSASHPRNYSVCFQIGLNNSTLASVSLLHTILVLIILNTKCKVMTRCFFGHVCNRDQTTRVVTKAKQVSLRKIVDRLMDMSNLVQVISKHRPDAWVFFRLLMLKFPPSRLLLPFLLGSEG